MVARKTTTNNGKTEVTEKEIIETEKEHLGDVDKKTGIYAEDPLDEDVSEMFTEGKLVTFGNVTTAAVQLTIYDELNRIQQKLNAPKKQYNNFGKYKYRSLEDILEGYKIVQGDTSLVISDEIVEIGDRFYVKATATLYYKGESVSNTAYAREPFTKKGMDDSQITGATSSYARKYALNGLFSIDDNQDADTMSKEDNTEGQNDLVKTITKMFEDCKTIDELVVTWTEKVPQSFRKNPAIVAAKDARKKALS